MVLLTIIAAIAALCSREYWMRLAEDDKSPWRQRYRPWVIQGLITPWILWSVVIIGLGEWFPSFVPQIIDAQQARAPWFGHWLKWSMAGGFVVLFYWTAITYMWLVVRIVQKAKDKQEVFANIGLFLLFSGTIAGAFAYYYSWIHIASCICLALLPVVHFTMDLAETPHAFTTYSKATTQLKRGKIHDAELEVISQLEKRDDDFEGWMILAELYATQYRNIEDAARVILDICKHPAVRPLQVSLACHKLADWQLEIAENPVGARAALELLCRRLPGTHFATMAQQRIRQIPRTCEEFDELKQPRRIRLPALSENMDPVTDPNPTLARASRPAAIAEANRLSDKLTEEPNDISSREKLALVMAEKLGRLDLAVEQLTLLTEMATATDEQKSRWLAQVASWEFNRTHNKERFQDALRRIVTEYPQTTHAFAAQRRLYLLEMDFLERQYAMGSPA